jgi:hypothetical protein
MTIKVRSNFFETNSSSSHSISISHNSNINDTLDVDEEGVCHIFGQEFANDYQVYSDAQSKASYCALATEGNISRQQLLRRAIMDVTGASGVKFYPDGGYIDHQSVHVADDIFSSIDSVKQFIFSTQSFLETDYN